jgi:hypothetical protein
LKLAGCAHELISDALRLRLSVCASRAYGKRYPPWAFFGAMNCFKHGPYNRVVEPRARATRINPPCAAGPGWQR